MQSKLLVCTQADRLELAQDSGRLPEGMERIGYDSETGRYTFRDVNGAVYEGSPGAEFGGELKLISGPVHSGRIGARIRVSGHRRYLTRACPFR